MCPVNPSITRLLLAMLILLDAGSARALVFYSTGDPAYNTTPPTGALTNSGWQWQGQWGGFCGTPIGPHHFIAAQHVGGSVGGSFVLDGQTYTTMAVFNDSTDLRIWQVDGTFPSYAPLYTNQNELYQPLVVFGRGVGRGNEVRLPDNPSGQLHGWQWGGSGVLRWGQNTVGSILDQWGVSGALLRASFSATGGPNEAHLAQNDSSGAVFIQDGGVWKLAGINYAVNGPFNYTTNGGGFNAALFDTGGFYSGGTSNWSLTPDVGYDLPSGFYATRISTRLSWIRGIVAEETEPPTSDIPALPLWAQGALAAALLAAGRTLLRTGRSARA